MKGDPLGTATAFNKMVPRQGGSFNLSSNATYPEDSISYTTGNHYPEGSKPFIVSIYNMEKSEREVTLTLLINPKDLQIGQVHMVNNAYTRRGWVSTVWGRQQATITATGSSAGFYVDSNTIRDDGGLVDEGLVNYSRKNSLAFINLQTLVAMFKNGGQYYVNTPSEQTMFKDGRSRVIHVLDPIMISYDEIDYLGSFNTFTIDERAEMPYRLEYNFEFVISALRGYGIEGHLRMSDNDKNPEIEFAIQGSDVTLSPTAVLMDADQATKDFNLDPIPQAETDKGLMSQEEIDNETAYYKQFYLNQYKIVTTLVSNPKYSRFVVNNVKGYQNFIDEAAAKYPNVDPDLIAGVIARESAGRPTVESGAGAKGLMQMIDSTAKAMGVKNVNDPRDNILGGTRYLSQLLTQFNGNEEQALAAYNAGPAAQINHDALHNYKETREYVPAVLNYKNKFKEDRANNSVINAGNSH